MNMTRAVNQYKLVNIISIKIGIGIFGMLFKTIAIVGISASSPYSPFSINFASGSNLNIRGCLIPLSPVSVRPYEWFYSFGWF